MNQQPPGTPPQKTHKFDVAIIVAIIALAGTITAAIITATATITAASSKNPVPTTVTPIGGVNASFTVASTPADTTTTQTSTPTSTTLPTRNQRTTSTTPDGVTYQCAGSAPVGINITYGPSNSGLQATSLPFATHDDAISHTAQYYAITAQLQGGGDVTCTVTVTGAGHTITSSGTARGGHNEATPQICSDFAAGWSACN
jgi:hypothetical protein